MMTFILTEFRFTEPLLQVYCPSESSVCNGLACFPARGQLAGNGSSFSTFQTNNNNLVQKKTLAYIIVADLPDVFFSLCHGTEEAVVTPYIG